VGKSTFGSEAPKPVFICTEDGVDNIPVDQMPKPATWTELLANVRRVAEEKHDYQTAVLDTLNGSVDLSLQHICREQYGGQMVAKKGDGGFLAFGQGFKSVSDEQLKLIALLDECRKRGLGIILLAHAGVQNVRNPISGDYMKCSPEIERVIWSRWFAWVDIVGHADYEYAVIKDGQRGKAVGGNVRHLRFAGSAAEDAKCRVGYELPDQMDLSYEAFAAALGKPDSTLEEIKSLWSVLTGDEAKKALAWLGVQRIEDAPLTKARQLLNRLREKDAAAQKQEVAA
jgi:hypothetical protein